MKQLIIAFQLVLIPIFCFSQISGFVKNSLDEPIENALVSHKLNPYVYTKTNEQGAFTITGSINANLEIAALHYTTKTVMVTSPNQVIILQTDELYSTDVYHISFDHVRPGPTYTKDELKQDFPVGYGKGVYDNTNAYTDRTFIDPTMDYSGDGRSICVKYPAGEVKTEQSGIDTRIPLSGKFNDNAFAADELYLSYWMRFSDNFDMEACGGKLPSLGGSNAYEREKEWKGRIMWGAGGSIRFYMELPHDEDGIDADSIRFWGEQLHNGGSICDNRFTPYLDNTQWHQIELHYKLEANGNPGLFEGWIDGNKAHEIIDSEEFGLYRRPGEGMDSLTINAILLSTFLGGGTGWEQDEDVFVWFDEFRVSTQRIGSSIAPKPKEVQTISLQKGWNLVSLYVEPTNALIASIFPNATQVKTQNGFYSNSIPTTLNSLTEIELGKGYLVYNSVDENLEISGSVDMPTLGVSTLKNGWNLIGVQSQTSLPLSTYPNAKIIKDFDGFYEEGSSLNSLSDLLPGKAYFLYTN